MFTSAPAWNDSRHHLLEMLTAPTNFVDDSDLKPNPCLIKMIMKKKELQGRVTNRFA